MLIAKIEDGFVVRVDDHQALFPNTSFPVTGPNKEFLDENSCLVVTVFKPHDQATEKLVSVSPYIEDNQVFTVAVEPLTQEELDTLKEVKATEIRTQRNQLLAECDWTQLSDAPVDKTAWAVYRQELRNITNQSGFPYDVQFPVTPN